MQLGMIGLGRMGANMVRRLLRAGHQCVAFDRNPSSVNDLARDGATAATSLDDLVKKLQRPRAIWLMVPAAVVDATLQDLAPKLDSGDIIIDGGNSYYIDDIRRSKELAAKSLHYVDVGTSGGVWGLERGYCQMIGGEKQVVEHLEPGYLMQMLDVAYHKLRPGSRIILETINPACWFAFFSSYIRLDNPGRKENREVRIFMNSPLSYEGETFYQSGTLADMCKGERHASDRLTVADGVGDGKGHLGPDGPVPRLPSIPQRQEHRRWATAAPFFRF